MYDIRQLLNLVKDIWHLQNPGKILDSICCNSIYKSDNK